MKICGISGKSCDVCTHNECQVPEPVVDFSPWQSEQDETVRRVAGKLGEEAAELAKICSRILIQGLKESDPKDGKPNLLALIEEVTDVQAAGTIALQHLDPNEDYADFCHHRFHRKLRQLNGWLSSL